MTVGIDASNIRAGGGVTHLREMLRAADPAGFGVQSVRVWGGSSTLSALKERPWLERVYEPMLDRTAFHRAWWQRYELPKRLSAVDALLVPGGIFQGDFHPYVAMSQNMLPFDPKMVKMYRVGSFKWAKLRMVKKLQLSTFRRADGVIFLSKFSRDWIGPLISPEPFPNCVIPHGIEQRFFPPERRDVEGDEFHVVYVSGVHWYKHQNDVAHSIAVLRAEGIPIRATFVGPVYFQPAGDALHQTIAALDPAGDFLLHAGKVSFDEIDRIYREADAFVFASACESFPNILLEAMASGLPIASSNRGPMPEILGEHGVYFDPEDSVSIASALRQLYGDPGLRRALASASQARALEYSWERCATETFSFLRQVAS